MKTKLIFGGTLAVIIGLAAALVVVYLQMDGQVEDIKKERDALLRKQDALQESIDVFSSRLDEMTRQPKTYTLNGSYLLMAQTMFSNGFRGWQVGQSCDGRIPNSPYWDISEGQQVFVKDGSGNILGAGYFEKGIGVEGASGWVNCSIPFSVRGLPKSSVYEVGATRESEGLFYSLQDLDGRGWQVSLQCCR